MVCLLAAGYALKWADGQILSAVLPQIQAEFRISDGTLGLLSGLPFAIFYTVLGVPIARLADTGHRRSLVAASLGLFSGFTAVAAAATSVPALFAARIGVGLGEAGATPPAQSLIADVVPAGRRGFALAIYGAGLNFGILAGFAVGGIVGGQFGWRAAFLVCGLPGLLVAVLTRLTIDEPGRFMTPAAPLRDVFAILARRPGFAHVLAANSLAGLAGFAALAWLPTFLGRTHGMALRDADLFLGVMSGIVGLAGVLLTGWLADLAGSRLPTMLAGLCLVTFPSLAAFYLVPGPALHAWLFILPALFGAAFAAPSAAIIHSIASPGTHATALSLLLFVVNLVGTACGPILTGFFSDLIGLRAALALTTLALPWAAWHFSRVRLAG
jgi:predicted MFS family arabinose efflux permease